MEAAVVRFNGDVYLVRSGKVGETRLVVQAMSDEIDEWDVKMVTLFANRYHPSLAGDYIPHLPFAIAQLIAQSFKGEVLGYTRYVGPPLSDAPGVVD